MPPIVTRATEIGVTVDRGCESSFPRRAYVNPRSSAGFSLINEVAEIGRAERKRQRMDGRSGAEWSGVERSGFLRKTAARRIKTGAFSPRITRVSGSGSQSHARPVNCRQLTRYTSRWRRLTLLCRPPPYRLYSGSPPLSFLSAGSYTPTSSGKPSFALLSA